MDKNNKATKLEELSQRLFEVYRKRIVELSDDINETVESMIEDFAEKISMNVEDFEKKITEDIEQLSKENE